MSTIFVNTTTDQPQILFDDAIKSVFTREKKQDQDGSHQVADIVLSMLFAFVFLVGTIGNILVYYYFKRKRRFRRTIPELLFSYMAVFDFFSSVVNSFYYFNFTLHHHRWYYGKFLCVLLPSLGSILTTIPGGIFVIIAIDRERAIVFSSMKHFTERFIKRAVILVILYATFLNLYLMLDFNLVDGTCKMTSSLRNKSFWIPRVICFLLRDCTLLFVFAFTNIRIVSRQRRYRDVGWSRGALWLKRRRDSLIIIRLMVVMATSYFMLTIPTDIFDMTVLISHLATDPIKGTPITELIYSYIQWLQTVNSCVNVLIYYKMHKGFHKYLKKLCCLRCRCKEVLHDDFLNDDL